MFKRSVRLGLLVAAVLALVLGSAAAAQASISTRYYSCGDATAKVTLNGTTGRTVAISIRSSQDIDDFDVLLIGAEQNDVGIPFSRYLSYDDSAYNGPSTGYVVLGNSGGWILGPQPDGNIYEWTFHFEFQDGTTCDTGWNPWS